MKDLRFDGADPNWVKQDVANGEGRKLPEDIDALQKEIDRLRLVN
jgi:hypothetical protein